MTEEDLKAMELGAVGSSQSGTVRELTAEVRKLRAALEKSEHANRSAYYAIKENLRGFEGDLRQLTEAYEASREVLADAVRPPS